MRLILLSCGNFWTNYTMQCPDPVQQIHYPVILCLALTVWAVQQPWPLLLRRLYWIISYSWRHFWTYFLNFTVGIHFWTSLLNITLDPSFGCHLYLIDKVTFGHRFWTSLLDVAFICPFLCHFLYHFWT